MATDASGGVVEKFKYGPYGELGSGTASGFPFRFTGQKLDPATGLYHYKARWYDPEVGRFLQTDPIGYDDQMNLYAYAHNDPLNRTDPTGEAAPLIVAGYAAYRAYRVGRVAYAAYRAYRTARAFRSIMQAGGVHTRSVQVSPERVALGAAALVAGAYVLNEITKSEEGGTYAAPPYDRGGRRTVTLHPPESSGERQGAEGRGEVESGGRGETSADRQRRREEGLRQQSRGAKEAEKRYEEWTEEPDPCAHNPCADDGV